MLILVHLLVHNHNDNDNNTHINTTTTTNNNNDKNDDNTFDRLNWGASGRGRRQHKSCYQKLCFMSKGISEFRIFITGFVVGLPPHVLDPHYALSE